jgi:hypothetical protein
MRSVRYCIPPHKLQDDEIRRICMWVPIHTKLWYENLKQGDHFGTWKCTIKPDLQEIDWEGVNCLQVGQDRNQWWLL